MPEEIVSPPYPSETASAARLHGLLVDLRNWVMAHRDALNEAAGRLVIPEPRVLPRLDVYQAQPVVFQYEDWVMVRKLREEWDTLVRLFEDAWDCHECVRRQMVLAQTAALHLNRACDNPEIREARAHEALMKMQMRLGLAGGSPFGTSVWTVLENPANEANEADPGN